MADSAERQHALYREATGTYGPALERLARAYEADEDRRRDLLQDIHVALWRSFAGFGGRCSLRTWTYRIAHNIAISQIRRQNPRAALVSLEDLISTADEPGTEQPFDRGMALDRLLALVETLKPLDREVIVLYLEGLDAASIGEVVGLTSGNVATKVHRIKQVLSRRFQEGSRYGA